jgi:nitric oxide reductase NorQ protein
MTLEQNQASNMSENATITLIDPRPMRGFVQTDRVKDITSRAMNYLRSGFPIHFQGATGTGKTTLALHLAHKLRQPVILIHGDAEFTTTDLVGKTEGYEYRKHVDEFVRGVSKTEEKLKKGWIENRLTTAVRNGFTLIYDEFTRSRPEANNILLSILQEGILDFPISNNGETFVQVHPKFRAIFTSNPEEYAGVHKTQDALLNRMVTIDLEHFDQETENRITAMKSGLSEEQADKVVNIARGLREESGGYLPTVRGCIMVGKSVKKHREAHVSHSSPIFRQICRDVFIAEMARNQKRERKHELHNLLNQLIDIHCQDENSQESDSYPLPVNLKEYEDVKIYGPKDELPSNGDVAQVMSEAKEEIQAYKIEKQF